MRTLCLILLTACGSAEPEPLVPDGSVGGLACGAPEEAVSFETSDGVILVADYLPPSEEGAGVLVLLHMAPTSGFDRSSWPSSFRSALAASGLGVLTVDRRGAGASGGEASDAAEGPGGRLDVEAAVSALTASDSVCPIASDRIGLIAASNGTTAALDYAVGHDAQLPDPDAMVFLSPGTYTENQNAVAPAGLGLPLLWVYPTNEPYTDGVVDGAPSEWEFLRTGTEHGTNMFDGGDLEDEVSTALIDFATRTVGR